MTPVFFFFVKIALATQGLPWFYMNFRIAFFSSVKIGIFLNFTESVGHFE